MLSDADTVAPALAATAVAGTSKVIEADGLMLRAVERMPVPPGRPGEPGLCTLALLSASANDPAEVPNPAAGDEGPVLLPDDAATAAAEGCGTVVLETVSYTGRPVRPGGLRGRGAPLTSLFSRRLRWSLGGVIGAVLALAVASSLTTGDDPVHAAYLSLLDLFGINDPAIGDSPARKVLQLLSGLTGLLLLPVLVAAAFEGLGTFRSASALRRPPRGLTGHVVLLGLGKVGTRVLARLHEMGIPVVCVESDPEARGVALARRLRVPTVLGDVTQEGVLEAAKVDRARTLLALTSEDTTNLEAALYARSVKPRLRVTLRLFDDRFATAVYRTLRAAHPGALTRSRSVSFLAAPAFAGAMMGRQILGAIPVERRVLLVARVEVRGQRSPGGPHHRSGAAPRTAAGAGRRQLGARRTGAEHRRRTAAAGQGARTRAPRARAGGRLHPASTGPRSAGRDPPGSGRSAGPSSAHCRDPAGLTPSRWPGPGNSRVRGVRDVVGVNGGERLRLLRRSPRTVGAVAVCGGVR